ncbi:MAG: DUF3558 domain-containing protein [Pseudonocardiaceae bacterium]
MRQSTLLPWALALATVLTAGCSAAQGGSVVASDTRSVPAQVHPQLSPPVEHPRDIRAFRDQPCEVLTTKQLKGFGFDLPPDSTYTLPSGNKACEWTDSGHNGGLVVSTFPDWDILERTYAHRAALPVFQPMQIAGLPAAAHQSGVGVPRCYVTVELAERQGLDVSFTDLRAPYEDPCGAARAVAEAVVGNLSPLG